MVVSFAQRFTSFFQWPTPSTLKQSTQLHAQMTVSGALLRHPPATLLLRSVADPKICDLSYALRLFSHLPNPSTFQWNTVMKACLLHHSPEFSIKMFIQMRRRGISPDSYTFHLLFKSCSFSSSSSCRHGYSAHAQFIKLFADSECPAPSSLIRMYVEFQQIDEAWKAFDQILVKDGPLWTTMVAGLAKAGLLDDALTLFDQMPGRNIISWTAMINGYSKTGRPREAITMFRRMLGDGVTPDSVAFVAVLAACAQSRDLDAGKSFHRLLERNGVVSSENLIVSLIDMYAKSGDIRTARSIFDSIARGIPPAWNAIIDGYCKIGDLDAARSLFDQMSSPDLITFNSMITGYIHSSRLQEALSLFTSLLASGLLPDKFTIVSLLSVCSSLGALHHGKLLHARVEITIDVPDIFVATGLLDMYAKCGRMEHAVAVFGRMPQRDVMAWTALISGFAVNGMGEAALAHFSMMRSAGIRPNAVSYIGVLHACSHSGFLDEGRRHFEEMRVLHGLEPEVEHYGCMVDLFGRLGRLEEAEKLIRSMRIEANDVIWASFLRSCRVYKNLELAEWSGRELIDLVPDRDVGYVQLYNTYIDVGRWEDASGIRRLMEERGVKKIAAFSSVAVGGLVHKFVAGDRSHPDAAEIREVMRGIAKRLEESGYSPISAGVSAGVEDEETERASSGHSERIAVAFGIMRLGGSLPIHVIKSLRVCGDCHSAIKMISELWGREIVVRDRARFHHFRGGQCSCNDFW
ncbi:Pentatricopeptide repeat-containing protein [Platanthera zijinensis]|uniref:Pentatricopeptide repeat-containing protein n=1 Tax=Platanthera zijinensis TaxID=2320716 RepID=A0AAP0BFM5_9ASPA